MREFFFTTQVLYFAYQKASQLSCFNTFSCSYTESLNNFCFNSTIESLQYQINRKDDLHLQISMGRLKKDLVANFCV